MIILTEKPSVAKSFAAALGVPWKQTHYENAGCCIVNAIGHLLENFKPDDYKPEWGKPWKLSALPIIPEEFKLKIIPATKKQLDIIKRCFDSRKNDSLLLATDAEREGELIGAEILEYVNFKNYSTAKRFWVSEALTKDVILKGIQNAKPLSDYAPYKEQGKARSQADWLIGMNLSRLASLGSGKTLAVGRVQTAVLAAVYAREAAIASFVKQPYFEFSAVCTNDSSPFTLKLLNPNNKEFPHRFNESDPQLLEAQSKIKSGNSAKVISLSKDKKTIPPPQLLNLTALQKESHKKLNLSPEETLNTAQALYETHKCLSYPRTPSRVMGNDNTDLFKSIFLKLKDLYPDYSADADPNAISKDNKRIFNSAALQDHHALIPLAPLPDSASPIERGIFNIVLNSFFQSLKPDYIYNAVNIQADIAGFNFLGHGAQILQQGWKQNMPADDAEETQVENISDIKEGASYPISSARTDQKFTEPKKYYTFASILSLMENPRGDDNSHLIGLGTPATRGNILDKLFKKYNYLELKNKNISITDSGKFLINALLKNESLKPVASISETTKWEEQLHKDTAAFLNNIISFVKNAVSNSIFDKAETIKESGLSKESLGKCPLCKHADVYEGKSNYYCADYKSGCPFVIWKESSGTQVSKDDVKLLLLGKPTPVKHCVSKDGKKYEARLFLNGTKLDRQYENSNKNSIKR